MARYFGEIGYGQSVEVRNGIYEFVITKRKYYGDVIVNARSIPDDQKVIGDLSIGNSISIVADAYAFEHFHAIQFAEWSGALWKVSRVEVQRPRLSLRLGEVYNGPKG